MAQLRRQVARYQTALGISTTNAYSTENRGGTSLVGVLCLPHESKRKRMLTSKKRRAFNVNLTKLLAIWIPWEFILLTKYTHVV